MSKKLLLADDSITIRKVVGIIFANEEDYSLTVVDNGNAAVEKAREIEPDIVMADVVMPGKNGYEVCEEIRRDPALDATPLLLLTGAFEPFDEAKAKESGADDFISKPFESQQLLDKVRALIELGEAKKAAKAAPKEEVAFVEPAPPPVAPPVAAAPEPVAPPVPPPAVAAPEPVAAMAPPSLEEQLFPQAFEPEPESAFLIEELSVADEAVEALPEDDLWGTFELDNISEGEPVELDLVEETAAAELTAPLTEEPSAQPFEPAAEETLQPWSPPEEETFVLGEDIPSVAELSVEEPSLAPSIEEPILAAETAAEERFVLGSEEEAVVLTEPAEEAVVFEPVSDLEFAAEEEYVPLTPPEPPPVPQAEEPRVAASSPASGEITLSEEQLASVLGKVSREIIEKIAWEVVPDLAEMLIREEIRKLKKGVQD